MTGTLHTSTVHHFKTLTVYKYLNSTKCSCITYTLGLWMLIRTGQEMSLQIILTTERLTAHITVIWALPTMYTLMCLQRTLLRKRFIAHITAIWTLPSMSAMMYLQVFTLLECSIAHITRILTFHSMFPLVLFHRILLTICSIQDSLLHKKSKKYYYFTNIKHSQIKF